MEHSEDNESKTEYFSTTEYSGGDMYASTSETVVAPQEPSARPGIISFICVLGFLSCAAALVIALAGLLDGLPAWYRPYTILGAAVTGAGYFGTWKMKKWGLYLLTIMFVVALIVVYNTQAGSVFNLVASAILLLVIAMHSSKMD